MPKLSEDLQSRIIEAKSLLKLGMNTKQVSKKVGLSLSLIYQIKKKEQEMTFNFGCVVCLGKTHALGFCAKHYQRYVGNPNKRNKKRCLVD